jgi:chromosome segregation ATPase
VTQSPVTVTYSLEEVLKEINQKLDTLKENVSDFRTETKVAIETIKGDINSLDEKLSGQINSLDEKLSGQINSLDGKLSGQINTLDEKVNGFGKRLDNQEIVNRGILIALVVAILGGAAKLFGFVGNP